MDFVYMCRDGENEELRYSIRSVYAHIKDPNIWVIGGKPKWYSGQHLVVPQDQGKHENVRKNLRSLCNSDKINENFILMNDDFFIMQDLDSIPQMHGGPLRDKILKYKRFAKHSSYTKLLSDTEKELMSMGIEDPLDYAIHVPMPMSKQNLSTTIYPDLSVRTMYGNIFKVGGTQIKDVKVYDKGPLWSNSYDYKQEDSIFISSNDTSFDLLYKNLLKGLLRKKTECER